MLTSSSREAAEMCLAPSRHLMKIAAAAMISGVRVVLPFLGPIGIDPLGDGVAMDAERFRGVGDSLLVAREGFLNVELFELCDSLIKRNVAIEHFFDYCF
jgi:hypothetical protein